ncbi:hypothetical protein E4U21_004467 [Claviceps maximensis]|nr:hypothetical protein E4U21_004467 [Claviceps maximensis]
MSWLGVTPLKKFPAPFRTSMLFASMVPPDAKAKANPHANDLEIVKPMWPFFAAGLVIAYGVNSAQNAMMGSDEWKNDPRNPKAKTGGH